jgi:hypothetical protein
MSRRITTLSIVLAALACGCSGLPFAHESQGVGSRTTEPWGAGPNSRSLLYARDGSPVPNQTGGAVTTTDGAARDLGDDDGSRPYLLELYQSAVDQKEKLELEVTALQRQLDEAGRQAAAKEAENQALQQKIKSYEEEVATRDRDNVELAARLATAQIRRLEAEKLVLETTLEWSHFQAQRPESSGDESDETATEDER